MLPRRILKQMDCDPVALHDGVLSARHLCCNSKPKPVFIKSEGRFQVCGRELRCDPQKARHGKDHSVSEIVPGRQLTTARVPQCLFRIKQTAGLQLSGTTTARAPIPSYPNRKEMAMKTFTLEQAHALLPVLKST